MTYNTYFLIYVHTMSGTPQSDSHVTYIAKVTNLILFFKFSQAKLTRTQEKQMVKMEWMNINMKRFMKIWRIKLETKDPHVNLW